MCHMYLFLFSNMCLHLTRLLSLKLSLPFSFFFCSPIMNNELVLLWSGLLGISAACVRACLMDCCMLIWLEDDGQFSVGVTGEIKEPFVRIWAMCLWQTGTDLESLPLYLCTATGEGRIMGNNRLCHYWFREGYVCLGVLDLCKLLQSVYVGNRQPLNTLLDGFG